MNGADALIHSLIDHGVSACFANPGTSEMQFVHALDRNMAMRSVLCLFEGVATGAADGYGRMAVAPACTLLHLGPGYGNGLANLHNARRAYTPIINIIGDHTTDHRRHDAPLNSDIAAIAAPNSVWIESAETADAIPALTARAIEASLGPPGGPASLILPADAAWTPTKAMTVKAMPRPPAPPSNEVIEAVVRALATAKRPVLHLGGKACRSESLIHAARLAAHGVRVFTDTFIPRQPRGAGVFTPDRIAYYAEDAVADLQGVDLMIQVCTQAPVAFFAYPDRPSVLAPEDCQILTLATRAEAPDIALSALADALDAPRNPTFASPGEIGRPSGRLTAATIGASIARHLPEGAIVCDDAVTSSASIAATCHGAAPHEVLGLTGGAIGAAMPMAIGAAIAAPDRKIVALSGDGSAMYTNQSLWTIARERLDVTVVIFANRVYRVLRHEMARTGAGEPGKVAARLLDLDDPSIDWCAMAKAMGVEAVHCDSAEAFDKAFAVAMREPGPRLIAAAL